jgi:hypothetical protein
MRRRTAVLLPVLLCLGWVLTLFAPVLSPAVALANRDVPVFHLPLRSAFRDLAAHGLPVWNPWLHGGQPILSNPSYGAFYPPSWLVFAVSPTYALSLMAILHAAVAFAGGWRLARHFGCGRAAAALGAVGYSGCTAYLSLLSAYTLFGSMAWFPWVVLYGDEALRREGSWWPPALLAGGALGLQLLNGEPSTVVISGLALLALAVSAAGRRLSAAPRVLVPVLFGVALAAVQLLPTLGRLADSPRKDIASHIATIWSMPPERLVELAFPRFFGDSNRALRGLFVGWKLNDRDFPYVLSLYPGLLLTILGLSALLRWRIPRRAAWALCAGIGILLALGRHNPVYEILRTAVPMLAILRFPEKFILLTIFALGFAGVLGWQRLLDDRDAGRPDSADFPLALSAVMLATAVTLFLLLLLEPRAAAWFIYRHGSPDLTPSARSGVVFYLLVESLAAVVTAAAVTALLALCRWRRPSRRLLGGLALLVLACDLWHYGHGMVQTVPADIYRRPAPLLASLLPLDNRIFTEVLPEGERDLILQNGEPQSWIARTSVAALTPYAGLLWDVPYAFDADFEMMLTGWGRQAERILVSEAPRPQTVYRYLGVWNIGTILRPLREKEAKGKEKDPNTLPMKTVANTYVLPRFRFVPRVSFHPTHAAALAAARSGNWRVARHEQCVRPGRTPSSASFTRPPRLLGIVDEGGRIEARDQSPEGAFLVAAMTFDKGWTASVEGRPVATYPTAACQIGVELPPGEHRLVLRYRDPLVGIGGGVTLAALVAGAAALLLTGRRRRGPSGAGPHSPNPSLPASPPPAGREGL